jgi:hypothetical protein
MQFPGLYRRIDRRGTGAQGAHIHWRVRWGDHRELHSEPLGSRTTLALIGRVLHDRRLYRDLDRVPAVRLIRSERAARPARVAPPASREGAHPTCRQPRCRYPGRRSRPGGPNCPSRTGRCRTGWATSSAPERRRPSAGAKLGDQGVRRTTREEEPRRRQQPAAVPLRGHPCRYR